MDACGVLKSATGRWRQPEIGFRRHPEHHVHQPRDGSKDEQQLRGHPAAAPVESKSRWLTSRGPSKRLPSITWKSLSTHVPPREFRSGKNSQDDTGQPQPSALGQADFL